MKLRHRENLLSIRRGLSRIARAARTQYPSIPVCYEDQRRGMSQLTGGFTQSLSTHYLGSDLACGQGDMALTTLQGRYGGQISGR
jgi:hypothetical protein